MMNFLRTFLACVLGTLAAVLILSFLLQVALAPAGPPALRDDTMLVIGPETAVNDEGGAPNWEALAGGAALPVPLHAAVAALDAAATDDRIVGILLTGGGPTVEDWTQRRELRAALQRFRAEGKRVWAHADAWDAPAWFLAAGADAIGVEPLGHFELSGFAFRMFYFAEALEKLGVRVQTTRAGKYKSAVEPFLLQHSSPENDEQLAAVLADLEATVLGEAAAARGLRAEELAAFSRERGWCTGEEAVERGLLDRVQPLPELIEELRQASGDGGEGAGFRQISFRDWLARQRPRRGGERTVAVIYAEGEIVDGESEAEIGGATLSRRLRELRQDDGVDAVVLRVDSPGGSAAASERIRHEVRLLRESKPVVVSMGGLAASGGYWISCSATRVIADPTTITGSIGVLGLLPDISGALARLGVSVETVSTSPWADADGMFRARDEAEMARVQELVDGIYEGFLDRVAEGRGLARERVHELAQGRVWSGADAVEYGLVDALGGLGDAVRLAAELAGAGVEGYRVRWLDHEPDPIERTLDAFFGGSPEPVAALPASLAAAAHEARAWLGGRSTAGVVPLARLPFSLRLR